MTCVSGTLTENMLLWRYFGHINLEKVSAVCFGHIDFERVAAAFVVGTSTWKVVLGH